MTSIGGEAMMMMNIINSSSGAGAGYPSTLLPILSQRSYYQRYLLQKTTCRDNVFEAINPMHNQILSIPLSTPKMPNNGSKKIKRKKKHKPRSVRTRVGRRLCQIKKGSFLRCKVGGDSLKRMSISSTSSSSDITHEEMIDEGTRTIMLSPRVSIFQQEEEEATFIAPVTTLSPPSPSLSLSLLLLLSVSNNSSNDCDDW